MCEPMKNNPKLHIQEIYKAIKNEINEPNKTQGEIYLKKYRPTGVWWRGRRGCSPGDRRACGGRQRHGGEGSNQHIKRGREGSRGYHGEW